MFDILSACVLAALGMALSETATFGFVENVAKLLEKARDALKRGGMDVDAALASLRALIGTALAANAEQHELRRQSMAATARSDEATHRAYVGGSGFLDMAIAAVQKDSPEAAEFRRLRSRIGRPPAEPPVSATPEPGEAEKA